MEQQKLPNVTIAIVLGILSFLCCCFSVGIGGVLSMGCTIGQGVSGVSTLAIGSFITLISIIIGSAIVMKIEYYNAVYEDCSFFDSLRSSLADLNLIPNKFRTLEKI